MKAFVVLLISSIILEVVFCSPLTTFDNFEVQCKKYGRCPTCKSDLEAYSNCNSECHTKCHQGEIRACPAICEEGCFCKLGYKRLNGECVPEEQCSGSNSCTKPNEIYKTCGNQCAEKCGNENRACTLDCQQGCFCKDGFKRNSDGDCVPQDQCPKCDTNSCQGPNEEYKTCGNNCHDSCGKENLLCPAVCHEGCFCRQNFKRHPVSGKCVPQQECPKSNTKSCQDPNEEWNEEGDACSEACDRAVKTCGPEKTPGCYCKIGFLRDQKLGICIPEGQCPILGVDLNCDESEVYKCGNTCWDYCDDGALRKCSGDCRYGCYCKEGYKFDPKTNKCVKENDCPAVSIPESCPGPNEIFKHDGSACADKCNKHLVRCSDDRKPGCYCIDGFARDLKTNYCRPYPCKECGENASYQICTGSCDNECSFVLKKDHCTINHFKCPDDCRCDKGFARSKNGTCIPESQCEADAESFT